jgi:hypothetical protein
MIESRKSRSRSESSESPLAYHDMIRISSSFRNQSRRAGGPSFPAGRDESTPAGSHLVAFAETKKESVLASESSCPIRSSLCDEDTGLRLLLVGLNILRDSHSRTMEESKEMQGLTTLSISNMWESFIIQGYSWRPRGFLMMMGWLMLMTFLRSMLSSMLSVSGRQEETHPDFYKAFRTRRLGLARNKLPVSILDIETDLAIFSNQTHLVNVSARTNRTLSEWLSDPDVITWKMDWKFQVTTGLLARTSSDC